MRIRVIGCGWYGAHIALSFIRNGHEVDVFEIGEQIFAGASGGNPARLHKGFHYPRSRLTRAACQEHAEEFEKHYGHLTRCVAVNIYAVAAHDSQVDFGTYCQVLRGEVEFIVTHNPRDHGLGEVEGAVLTGERHILVNAAREFFSKELGSRIHLCKAPGCIDDPTWDVNIDTTFCANDFENIDRFEPCLMALLAGPADKGVTIMDGPFPSIIPWDEEQNLSSLTSAKLTPLSKTCRTYQEAKSILDSVTVDEARTRSNEMLEQMAYFWPEAKERYRVADHRLSIRAMPRSGSDARLVDVVRVGERAVRVRAGKIDAILHAERLVREIIGA